MYYIKKSILFHLTHLIRMPPFPPPQPASASIESSNSLISHCEGECFSQLVLGYDNSAFKICIFMFLVMFIIVKSDLLSHTILMYELH